MNRGGPILPPGASGSLKRGRGGGVGMPRKRARMQDGDEDEDASFGDLPGLDASLMGEKKKKKKTKNMDEDDDDLSDASGDEEAGVEAGSKVKQRDRTRTMALQLKKQGIDLDDDEAVDAEDEEEFREHLKAGQEANPSGIVFQSGKEQVDYQAPSREALENLFGRNNDEGEKESFSMGNRAQKHMYGKQGQVLEEEEEEGAVKDAWLEDWGDASKARRQKIAGGGAAGGGSALSAAGRLLSSKKTADPAMGPPIRRSKDPMTNLEIILSHVSPSETILKALRRMGNVKKGGAGAAGGARANVRKKNVRTKPSASGAAVSNGAPAQQSVTTAAIAEAKRAFEELTEAAQSLLDSGEIEIYSETYESVSRVLQRLRARKAEQEQKLAAKLAAEQRARNPSKEIHWQYKWNPADQQVHGPFVGSEMMEWKGDGYFEGDVVCQRVGPGHKEGAERGWIAASTVDSFLA